MPPLGRLAQIALCKAEGVEPDSVLGAHSDSLQKEIATAVSAAALAREIMLHTAPTFAIALSAWALTRFRTWPLRAPTFVTTLPAPRPSRLPTPKTRPASRFAPRMALTCLLASYDWVSPPGFPSASS